MRIVKVLKRIWAQLHRFVFWALILSLLWAWVYSTFVSDAPREKKVLLYVDSYGLERRALGLALEDACLPDGQIEMIQVRSFDYDIFSSYFEGDLYLMRESILKATMEESPEKLAPIPVPEGAEGWAWEGQNVAIRVFDPATQTGPAMALIGYAPPGGTEREAYYLCADAASLHLASRPGALDDAAWHVALALLAMDP